MFTEDLRFRLMTDIEEAALTPEERSDIAKLRLATVEAFGPPRVQ